MQSSTFEDGLSSAAERGACEGRDANMPSPLLTAEKGRTLTALKKIGFSARRALQMVSRSLDQRAGLQCGSDLSDGDILCKAQAPQVSPHFASAVLRHQSSENHFHIHRASFPFSKLSVSTDLSLDSPRLVDDKSWQPQMALSLQTPQPQQEQPPHQSQTAPPLPKPRSLLSAFFKCQSTSASANTDTAKAVPVPAPSGPIQKPGSSPSPRVTTSETSRESTSSNRHLVQPSSPTTVPQQGRSHNRLYDSLPAQQDRRNPAPYTMLVQQEPSPSTAANRINLSLSAPGPHLASLKRVLLRTEHHDTAAAKVIQAPPPPPPPSGSSTAAQTGASTNSTTSVAPKPAPRTFSTQLADAVKLFATSPAEAPGTLQVPQVAFAGEGATNGETAPCSVPAASILASSLGGSGLPGLASWGPGVRQQLNAPAPPSLAAQVAPEHSSSEGGATSMLLAMSSKVPKAMLRSVWALEHYSLQKRLYKGKMSSVYKARCLCSGMPVALKVYFKDRVPINVVHMLMREIRIHLLASDNRNILKLYGVFQNEDVIVMVMELAARGSLSNVCQNLNGGRLSEPQVRQTVLEPLLDALSYLHGRGVCHRDIKPENLLFTSDWGFRLADFGVSINMLEERAVTRAGTADYMAPEVERCPLKASAEENKEDISLAYTTAVDVWSVGVLVYELLVGFPPMTAGNGAAARCLSFPSSVSAGARDFITAALSQLPEERPTVRQLRCHPWMLGGGGQGHLGRPRGNEL
ncbi:hypothetical protein VaNZ11_003201 [Volvox africanus]|uniref:Protein kinase domain-containing protein n=1 Tax=Volvox africanus TaxID=51714 RepID=A0ABQ5RV52_9CHLO|nr:hypothetical protein VaNZ11_003201 [Volvox africanus]